ncbi:cytotoxic T-lymphocyte protein 4-like isoform X2 [Heptranchias perlo]|uniref:cytotoxic T-lymphocyte protein 4-like isoform X2 n=1 Tax=Heptranchias perlo TaxID=212740 RepID=UPI0035596990
MEFLICLLVVFLWSHTAERLAALTVSQPMFLEADSTGEATLECDHNCKQDAELKLTILKGRNGIEICSGTTNSSSNTLNTIGLLHCRIKQRANKVSVTLYGLNSSLIDNYFCKIQKMYPPIYESATGNGTLIHIKNKKCTQFLLLIIVGILGILTLFCMIYNIVLTSVSCMAKKPRKKEEENVVYEQMAPSTGGDQSRRNTELAATLLASRKY